VASSKLLDAAVARQRYDAIATKPDIGSIDLGNVSPFLNALSALAGFEHCFLAHQK